MKEIELKYCEYCMQMTNHEHLKNPLMDCWACMKCDGGKNEKNKI